jgi:hypothetical protein
MQHREPFVEREPYDHIVDALRQCGAGLRSGVRPVSGWRAELTRRQPQYAAGAERLGKHIDAATGRHRVSMLRTEESFMVFHPLFRTKHLVNFHL